MEIAKNKKRQDSHYHDVALERITDNLFCEFVAKTPTLYQGVNLDSGEIEYINNYFYEYRINPISFERHFITKLRRIVPIYNNMKAIELNEKIFDVTSNTYIRTLVSNTVNKLERNGTSNATTKNTGTIQDAATGTENNTQSINTNQSTTGDDTTKQATKTLPMTSNGSGDLDDIVDWSEGGSGISEAKTEHDTNVKNSGTITDNGSYTDSNTKTLNTDITTQDIQKLNDLGNTDVNDKETLEVVGDQAVKLIENIWKYLASPKGLDYLVKELESCFILVY